MTIYRLCVLHVLGILLRQSSEAFPLICRTSHTYLSFSLLRLHGKTSSSSSPPLSSSSSSDQSLCNECNSNNNTSDVTCTSLAHERQQQQQQQQQQSSALALQQQAAALRAQVDAMRQELQESQAQKLLREQQTIDQWIERLLFSPASASSSTTEMLNTVDQVVHRLQEDRFSHEQIRKIFHRICETETAPQSRSRCSELMRLLLDATCRMDCLERKDNPNKRWSGWVERDLQKRLFAKDWGIELEDTGEDASF